MSVRIYNLSKQTNIPNKELIALLQARGLKVDSPSNTIPDIYANALIEELAKNQPVQATEKPKTEEPTPAKKEEAPKPKKADIVLPQGAFIKSAADVENEKLVKAQPAPIPNIKPAPTPVLNTPPTPPLVKSAPQIAGIAPKIPPIAVKAAPMPPVALKEKSAGAAPLPIFAASKSAAIEVAPSAISEGTRIINVKPPIVVRDFSTLIGVKPFRLISELMEMGIFASMNQTIEEGVASRIAEKHGFSLEIRHRGETPLPTVKKEQLKPVTPKVLENRPPIVCVLGHVDHGKTTLLDTLRNTNVVKGEAGGITQHIGAYQIEYKSKKITFIDTPGHAAFSKMRERGANITDIAILVIAADDGFMPQTKEALKFAQKANVPIVVAINKMDAKGANIDRAKQQMQQNGIAPEDWGGETLCAPISALKAQNIDGLLELILLQAEMLELQADMNCPAEGTVVESQVEVGRGPTATVIVESGVLKTGDAIVCGTSFGKVRALIDDKGKTINSAGPATPVRILGLSDAPEAGSTFIIVKNEKDARSIAEANKEELRRSAITTAAPIKANDIQDLFNAIAQVKHKTLKVIIKADVNGSAEALKACLEDIKSEKVSLEVLTSSVGLVSKNDIATASAAGAVIVGFNTKLDNGVSALAKHNNIQIIQHNIIYELITQVKEAMAELLDPEVREEKLGAAEIRQVFGVAKGGSVAGCMVTEGRVLRDAHARLIRKGKTIAQGQIQTLKRFKEDASEVRAGYECGIALSNTSDYQAGDTIECFELKKFRPSL